MAAELVTASLLNTQLRDNLNFLHDNMKPTSIQRGTISISGGGVLTNTAAITAVVSVAVSEIFHSGEGISDNNNMQARVTLTDTTTVTATRGSAGAGGTTVVGFQVTEWPT